MIAQTLTLRQHSHSRLQAYTQCALSYRLQFIDKLPAESSDALEIGAAAHQFFEKWVKYRGIIDDRIVQEIAAECFQKEPRSQSNFKDYLDICQTFVRAYHADPDYPVNRCEAQAAFSADWKPCGWFDSNVMFRAKIDRIDEPKPNGSEIKKIRLVDYKTGFAGSLDSFQLDVYAWVASLLYPSLEHVEVEFYYVKSGFKQVKLLEVKDLDIVKVQLEALIAKIDSDTKFKARPGARCLTCPVALHCSERPSDLKAIKSLEDAQTLGTEIALLEAQAKAKKRVLNAYCQEQGPVEANGLKWAHYPAESYVVEMAPLLSLCVQYGVYPGEILNPDTTALRKLFKENPVFAEAVSPYVSVDVSSRFYAKKSKETEE